MQPPGFPSPKRLARDRIQVMLPPRSGTVGRGQLEPEQLKNPRPKKKAPPASADLATAIASLPLPFPLAAPSIIPGKSNI